MNQSLRIDLTQIVNEYEDLKRIHNEIWELEAELKTGREAELSLEEIGRRAVAIRDHNNKRIRLKNSMAEKLNCSVREIKKDHLSE
jgi:DNA polymerase III delta prime subunit